jgi:hypothetical protein
MKKFLLFSLTAAFSFTFLNAQTPYYTSTVGSPGYHMSISQDTSVDVTDMTLNVGTVGTGLIWNFQGLDADLLDTINFDFLNAQEMTEFPTGNEVVESNLGRIVFDKDNANGLFLIGTGMTVLGNYVGLNYTPPQKHLDDVNNVGTTFNTLSLVDEKVYVGIDTTVFGCHINVDSIEFKRRSNYTVNFDASGELRLPTDTFAYTLRASTIETTIDSIFIYSPLGMSGPACGAFGLTAPVGWSLAPDNLIALSMIATSAVQRDTMLTLEWYHPQGVFPFCVVDYTFDPGFSDTTFNSVRFKATDGSDIGFEEYTPIDMSLYPNPASTTITIQSNADLSQATMYMYNAQGQQVRAVLLNGGNTVDISFFENGMYFYQVVEGNKLLHNGKFIVKK